jgi:peptide/nickel transport system permease protein
MTPTARPPDNARPPGSARPPYNVRPSDKARAGGPVARLRRVSWSPALVFLGLVFLVALLAPLLLGDRAFRVDLNAMLEPPSRTHVLGTDENGRDMLARLLWGARATLGIGLGGAALAVVIGVALGAAAGYWGGWIDVAAMRVVDFALAFPSLFVILLFSAVFSTGVPQLIVLIGLTGWMTVARLTRGVVRGLATSPFVESAHAIGASDVRIALRHLLPNATSVLIVASLSQLNRAILTEATISFLGMGVKPPEPTWGNLLIGAQDYLWSAPWLAVVPGVAITATLLAIFTLGDHRR